MMGLTVHRAGIGPAGGGGLLLTDLVAHWDMGEASGNRLDSVGILHAVPVGTPSQAAGVGVGQYAYSQTASPNTNGLVIPHDAGLVPSTDGLWVANWWQYHTGGGGYAMALSKASGGEYEVNRENTAVAWGGWARNAANSGRYGTGLTTDYASNAWTMVTFAIDRISGEIRLYLDGTLKKTGSLPDVRTNGTADLHLGRRESASSSVVYAGRFQALSVWKGPGAQNAIDELAWLYNSGSAARLYADLEAYTG
jgi:hypothetical protein